MSAKSITTKSMSGDLRGFTLVELLIVIAILAILAAIALPQFIKYKDRTYDAELESDAKNAYTASVAYLSDNPGETVGALTALTGAGYSRSPNIIFESGTMTTTSGSISLVSTAAQGTRNTATINFNGNIDFAD